MKLLGGSEQNGGEIILSQEHFQNLINGKIRRLQKLKEQQSLKGPNAPPELLIEIEDLEAESLLFLLFGIVFNIIRENSESEILKSLKLIKLL